MPLPPAAEPPAESAAESAAGADTDPYGLASLAQRARRAAPTHRRAVEALRRRPPPDLDARLAALTDEAFDTQRGGIDCLRCANCCRTTPPRLTPADTDRLARHLRLRPAEFAQRYLRTDADGDTVMAATPCPFLGGDNHCAVYDVRPLACRDYPHTAQRRQAQLLPLHLVNAAICPAVFRILERLAQGR